jgi:hypothetical protein
MRIAGHGTETYLFLNGIVVTRKLVLGDHVELWPADCSPEPDAIIKGSRSEIDIGVSTIFLRQVRSQIRVTADNSKQLATRAWNSIWDAVLLSAFCDCEAVCNLQSDAPAERFGQGSQLRVTNYHLRGLVAEPHVISEAEAVWIEANVGAARALLERPRFRDAVHALASYRWHSLPRARLALLWAGIEGLFGVDSEIVFRLSLYVARFLAPNDAHERGQIFAGVKKLYKYRSAAVHGSQIKGDPPGLVKDSVDLLQRLLRRCVELRDLPQVEMLVP